MCVEERDRASSEGPFTGLDGGAVRDLVPLRERWVEMEALNAGVQGDGDGSEENGGSTNLQL